MLFRFIDAAIRFSKKVVVVMFAMITVFTIVMIVTYYIMGDVPDVLIENFFGFFKIEGGALSVITIADKVVSWLRGDDTNEKTDEATLPRAE